MREIDIRLKHLEKLYETVTGLGNMAVGSFEGYLLQKAESENRSREIEDRQNKRSTNLVIYSITLIFVLCLICLFKGQFALVKVILTSSLAVGTGVGLHSVFRGKKG